MSSLDPLGLQCYVGCSTSRIEARACIMDQGVAVIPIREETPRKARWRLQRRKPDKTPLLQPMLSFDDLLGATIDDKANTLRLVHCPRQGSHQQRIRQDMILSLAESNLTPSREWATKVTERCNPGKRRLLILVNPASGIRGAPQVWQTTEDFWSAVPGIQCLAVTTSDPGHAREYVKSMDLESYDAIVIISGDGLVHEVWNGLAARPDADRALALPIGHIPGGSGNGLAKSVLESVGESYGILDAAFCIAKGGHQPIDLMHVQAGDEQRRTSFLSLTAATISDVDIASERLRCIGPARFTLWGIWRVLRPVRLRAELLYWPAEAPGQPSAEPPPLSAQLEDQSPWKKILDDFTVFWGCNTEWVAWNSKPAPGARLSDGTWQLVLLRGRSASRTRLLRFLLGQETGEHIRVPGVEIVRCRAFRLIPRSKGGILALDGERLPFGPVQVWPSRYNGRVVGGEPSNSRLPEASV